MRCSERGRDRRVAGRLGALALLVGEAPDLAGQLPRHLLHDVVGLGAGRGPVGRVRPERRPGRPPTPRPIPRPTPTTIPTMISM